jgi:hypothetical protein
MDEQPHSLVTLDQLQERIARWRNYNFPGHTAWEQLLGVVEEIGELAHSELKAMQGIRGSKDQHEAAAKDAVGDLVIFLMGYAQVRGWKISECVLAAWNEVKDRNWVQYPDTGLPPKPLESGMR